MPQYPPIAFYSAVRLGDPEQLAKIMDTDPYFVTQDNGAGAPIHFATTYKQLDMVRCSPVVTRAVLSPTADALHLLPSALYPPLPHNISPLLTPGAPPAEQWGGGEPA